MENSKPTYNFPHKALHVGGRNFGKGLRLYPLSEIIDCYNQKPPLAGHWWEGSNNVHAPLGERPRSADHLKVSGWLVNQGVVLLAASALPHILGTVLAGDRPVVSCSDDPSSQSPMTIIHSTYAVVKLVHHILGLFLAYAYQQGSVNPLLYRSSPMRT